MEEDLIKKAVLTLGGPVRLPDGYTLPCRVSRSTAGPGAGFGSFAFSFNGYRVKKSFTYEPAEFELVVSDSGLSITRFGEPFLDSVQIEPIIRHCPEQAFFNIDPRCMYRCAYCNSPLLDMKEDKHLSAEKIMGMLRESVSEHEVKAVSFTSGVVGSVQQTVNRFVEVVSMVRAEYPGMPIGVEPYVDCREQIQALKDAGADEIKINVETPTKELFDKVCPGLDYDGVFDRLNDAVEIFGKGKVVSNIIYGMGETDEQMRDIMEKLCSMGVIPGIRALRLNSINMVQMEGVVGSLEPTFADRVIELAVMQKSIMEKHGLTTLTSRTMCMECGCCDLVPFRDF